MSTIFSICGNRRSNLKLSSLYPLSIAITLALSSMAQAATFTVSNINNSGAGSLRQAVLDANASAGADQINFSVVSGSTITLSSSELLITDSLKITGPSAGNSSSITLNGAANSRVIRATIPAGGHLTLENMTLSNGLFNGRGGALRMGGSGTGELVLNHSVVTNSHATGYFHEGGGLYVENAQITLNNSTISNNTTSGNKSPGGGIFANEVTISLNNSTISGNSTSGSQSSGGGLYSDGAVTVNNSTVSNNHTTGSASTGGGLYIFLDVSKNQSAVLNQTTISGNTTSGSSAHGGGLAVFKGDTILNNSTITNNTSSGAGGGFFALVQSYSVFFNNTILSGNTGFLGNFYGAQPSTGKVNADHSLFGDASTEITGTNVINKFSNNPSLGVLLSNGGATLTHLPNTGSLALNNGNNAKASAFTNDQRGVGYFRVQNSAVDIGAVEKQATVTTPLLISPLGTSVNPPVFRWKKVTGASSYTLLVNELDRNLTNPVQKINSNYTSAQAGCTSSQICEVSPNVRFAISAGQWWVTSHKNGVNNQSDSGIFSIVLPSSLPPVNPTISTPSVPTSTVTTTETPASTTTAESPEVPSTSQTESNGGGTLSKGLLGLLFLLGLFRRSYFKINLSHHSQYFDRDA